MWSTKWLWRANETPAAETGADGGDERSFLLKRVDSFDRKLEKENKVGSRKRDVVLAKRHRVLILARILLAVPGPAFLTFSAIQHFEITTVTAGWALSAPITQLETGREFALAVGLITIPLWILSFLIAQIEKTAQKFAKGSRVFVKRSSGDESFGYVKKYDAKEQQPYTVELESGKDEKFDEAEIEKKPAQKFANGSRVLVKRSSGDESFGYVKEYNEKTQVYTVELKTGPPEELDTGEGSMRDALVISRERLVRLWKYFLSLWKWDQRIWTWPKAFEAALFWGCVLGYALLYQADWIRALLLFLLFAPFVIALILYMVTKIVQSIIDYQYNQKAEYHTFVNLQAVRLSILTIFGVCLTVYAVSAMSRVVIPNILVVPFVELSLSGITCTDRDAFWTTFNASFESDNASCHALPNCGYASFESLCQAVQYAPMVQAVSVDLAIVLIFNWVAWLLGSLLVFGTGRASLKNGYTQLLSKHMLVAMVLGLGQLMSACYSLVRLLTLVPMLRLPRPAAYFDDKGLMYWELPFFCYDTCTLNYYWVSIFVHVLIAVALNFDFLKKYASAIGAGDQAAINKLKEKMRKEGEWSDEAPYFYFMTATFVKECDDKRLPPMQELLDDGHLEKIRIRLVDAFKQAEEEARLAKEKAAAEKAAAENVVYGKDNSKGIDESNQADEKEAAEKAAAENAVAKKEIQGIDMGDGTDAFKIKNIKDVLFVSHRWEEPGRPDVNGMQLQAIKEYLKEHPDIKWVWFDYSSMPQKIGSFGGIDTRSLKERAKFQLMLECIPNLYLTAQVLILLDGSYASRFWTLTEAWCSMQTATKDGLENSISSTEDADFTGSDVKVGSRCTIKCIHNAAKDTTSKGLVNLVSTQTPEGMHGILEKPDVNVTNAKDKETILPKILEIDKDVIERFKNGVKKLQSPQSPPALTQLLKNESGVPDTSDKAVDSLFVMMDSDKNGLIDKSELTQASRWFEGGSEPASASLTTAIGPGDGPAGGARAVRSWSLASWAGRGETMGETDA